MLEALTLSEVRDHLTLVGPGEDDQTNSTQLKNHHSPAPTGKVMLITGFRFLIILSLFSVLTLNAY